ncbi:hypothetical protein F2P56_035499 [Juglans regia]|uniref:Uncharacterized protein LOC108993460 n=2 Tax=Juglans regia TaxID=51240 RepID=A0A2I4EWZ9_JUGRE|nr:uncharacterized protein LOC108993460 [Juglans regia]KAF5442887.1 hypothetical protein F2P56_035499 [Juglans regia]
MEDDYTDEKEDVDELERRMWRDKMRLKRLKEQDKYTQSAFVPGRMISDNTIVAYELMHSMQNRRKKHKEAFMALKLDMSKAYDRLEWSFIQQVLQRMGFAKEWIELVMQCISTVSYSILLNGSPQASFNPSRDDSLVFCKAQMQEWIRLHNIISLYESASGQRLNLEKSSIFFSKNTRHEIQSSILSIAGIKASGPFERYLGLPSYIGRSKSRAFFPILDRIKAQMSRWKTNLLSPAATDFSTARVKRGDSFVWKSITAGRQLLYEGLIWKIGNGNIVKIWSNKWLPTPTSYKSQSQPKVLCLEATVNSLIDQETHSWNIPLVQNIFTPEEAAIISRIHVSACNSNDKQVWRCTKNGLFTVKSAYHLQVSLNDNKMGQASDTSNHEALWNRLWKLKVPNKIKIFIWRSAREILPTRVNLHKRKIIDSPMCPICLIHPETVSHVLWTCKAAQDVWSISSRRIQKSKTEVASFNDLLSNLLSTLPPEDHTRLAFTAKEIWFRRNKFVFESKFTPPQQILKLVSSSMTDLEQIERNQHRTSTQIQGTARWCKPPINVYKLNWDTAIDKINCRVGIGVSIRDWLGLVTATLRSPCNSFPDPLLGEALAALRSVQFGINLGLKNVIFEGDSKLVVHGITSGAED